MTTAQPMETAPTDGTRVLVRDEVWHYVDGRWLKVGHQWVEAWHDGERWQEWCGTKRTKSTNSVKPTAWAEKPKRVVL